MIHQANEDSESLYHYTIDSIKEKIAAVFFYFS